MKKILLPLGLVTVILLIKLNAQEDNHHYASEEIELQIKRSEAVELAITNFQSALNVNCKDLSKRMELVGGKNENNCTIYQYTYPQICDSMDKEFLKTFEFTIFIQHKVCDKDDLNEFKVTAHKVTSDH
ncbi:MAG: hypothetical protein QE271_13850 [Bacteriovoracaceae bacterium]|nr:hypothetical protein [Bacteriovoracaceae bacterium]